MDFHDTVLRKVDGEAVDALDGFGCSSIEGRLGVCGTGSVIGSAVTVLLAIFKDVAFQSSGRQHCKRDD